MDPDRWRRIQEIFDAAMDLPPERRSEYIRSQAGEDDSLAREVADLVSAGDRSGDGFIEKTIKATVEAESRIGPYRVLEQIGRGGMGTVLLAVRDDDQFRKKVAIKRVRSGLQRPDVLQRFRSERQILANLEHPNIARLLDGGATDDGPYVVMEYVEGEPIHRYCWGRDLTVEQRLRLFQSVCDAVQFAHSNLIVHRDLKPSNILVTAEGVPKLLDFGIAKLLDPSQVPYTVAETRTHMRLLTPEYASPEQIRGESITTASDVYSLGVLLYELLTGRRPFDLRDTTPAAIERAICETEPPRPSAVARRRVRESGETDPPITSRYVQDLPRHLKGDLDNVLLKALRKDPERRYASPAQFAEDIERHLSGLPVMARPDTWGYRASKFVRRNRWGVAAAAAFVLLLAAFAVTMSFQAARIARQRDAVQLERERSERVAAFMVDLFNVADPDAKGADLTARELLDRGRAELSTKLTDQPQVRATMLSAMGTVYYQLGMYEDAEQIHREVVALLDVPAPEPAARKELASALDDLGNSLYQTARYDEAETHMRRALDLYRQAGAEEGAAGEADSASAAVVMHSLVRLLQAKGQADEAEAMARRALDELSRVEGEHRAVESGLYTQLAQLVELRGVFDEAGALYRRSLEIDRALYDGDHSEVAESLHNLGVNLQEQGKLEDAEPLLRESIAMQTRLTGPMHPAISPTLTALARLVQSRGDLAEAERLARQAVEIAVASQGLDHPFTAYDQLHLARLLLEKGEPVEAKSLVMLVVDTYRRNLDADHPWIASALLTRATIFADERSIALAERDLGEAMTICRAALPEDHWFTALVGAALGYTAGKAGRLDEAERLLSESHALLEEKRGADDANTRRVAQWLKDVRSRGRS